VTKSEGRLIRIFMSLWMSEEHGAIVWFTGLALFLLGILNGSLQMPRDPVNVFLLVNALLPETYDGYIIIQ
jgi:hypothetical protein